MSTWLATTTWPFHSCWVDSTINVGANIHVVHWPNSNWLGCSHVQLGLIDCDALEEFSGYLLCILPFAFAYPSISHPLFLNPTICFEVFFNPRALQFFCFDSVLSKNSLPAKNNSEEGAHGFLGIQTKSGYFCDVVQCSYVVLCVNRAVQM